MECPSLIFINDSLINVEVDYPDPYVFVKLFPWVKFLNDGHTKKYQYFKSSEVHDSCIWMSVGHSSSRELCDIEVSTSAVATNLMWLLNIWNMTRTTLELISSFL